LIGVGAELSLSLLSVDTGRMKRAKAGLYIPAGVMTQLPVQPTRTLDNGDEEGHIASDFFNIIY
jgi:hypothetical protein